MAKEQLSRIRSYLRQYIFSNRLDCDWWCFERSEGLEIHRALRAQSDRAIVPVAKIRAYLARLDRKE